MDADVQFVTNKMCPFAQKAWIALEEKKVDYELTEVGLYGSGGKPSWFIKMNPKGLVPVLRHGSKVVVESNDICKYIDAQFGSANSLCPPGEGKGSVEWWMQLMDSKVLPLGKQTINGRSSSSDQFHAALKEFDGAVKGPYLLGDDITLADIVAAPMIWRIRTEASSLNVTPKEYPNLCAWMDKVSSRPSFSKTVSASWWWWW